MPRIYVVAITLVLACLLFVAGFLARGAYDNAKIKKQEVAQLIKDDKAVVVLEKAHEKREAAIPVVITRIVEKSPDWASAPIPGAVLDGLCQSIGCQESGADAGLRSSEDKNQ